MADRIEKQNIVFSQVIGQKQAKSVLARSLQSERLSHAYLFIGMDGVGKEALAISFARSILCDRGPMGDKSSEIIPCEICPSCSQTSSFQHPNMRILFPLPKPKPSGDGSVEENYTAGQQKKISEVLSAKSKDYYSPLTVDGGTEILLDHIRSLRKEFTFTSYQGRSRIVIISQADRLRLQAANGFLKLLEEPPEGTVFILTTSRESKILPTIASRCQALRLPPLPVDTIRDALVSNRGIKEDIAAVSSRLAQGSWRGALKWASGNPATEMSKIVDLFRILLRGDPGEMDTNVDTLTQASSISDLPLILTLMSHWLGDVMRVSSFTDGYPELRQDQSLARFAEFVKGRPVNKAIEAIDEARLDLERRVHPPLVLHNLFMDLQEYLFSKSEPVH